MSKLKGKARVKANKKNKNKQKNDFYLRKKRLLGDIRKYDDPILAIECDIVPEGQDVKDIFKKMRYVLNATDNGVGLAASQIGETKRLVIIKPDSDSHDIIYMINPEIISTSGKKKFGKEGCLSYPNTYAFIERFTEVEISYHDENWKEHIIEYEEGNILGIIIQHELEHILGHCKIYEWWKDPEGKQKELEERFKKTEEKKSKYEVVESEDLKREREESNDEAIETFKKIDDGQDIKAVDDIKLYSIQEKMIEECKEEIEKNNEALKKGEIKAVEFKGPQIDIKK